MDQVKRPYYLIFLRGSLCLLIFECFNGPLNTASAFLCSALVGLLGELVGGIYEG